MEYLSMTSISAGLFGASYKDDCWMAGFGGLFT